ncbi:MBL fold metallo-hydrolase [Nocardioides sp. SR21]|uniref:MBL fold metallo-hydrolase n=1 Tax=Nocardioides sp. SR21 TaxID=2919501 RepID=UPI001FAA5685|nr:MBL fold metallo-hydrolase [Nocardioides sp. SR21]
MLVELDGWRILTDPTFDPPGREYAFGLGTSSTKTAGPALDSEQVGGPVDLVLVSHDHHADNLDDRGRELLPAAGAVVTTSSGARRLGLPNVRGLRAGQTLTLEGVDRPSLTVRATPCRHGPPLSGPIVGQVIGFALTLGDAEEVAVWMTGDTVLHRPVRRYADWLDVDVLLLHMGSVQFPITGPLRYSMNSADAAQLVRRTDPRVVVPVHYEGWSHFHEPESHARAALPAATWLEPGVATEV